MSEKKMNKFEMTRILSTRGLELSKGAKPKVDLGSEKKAMLSKDYVEVAKRELAEDKFDLEVYEKVEF